MSIRYRQGIYIRFKFPTRQRGWLEQDLSSDHCQSAATTYARFNHETISSVLFPCYMDVRSWYRCGGIGMADSTLTPIVPGYTYAWGSVPGSVYSRGCIDQRRTPGGRWRRYRTPWIEVVVFRAVFGKGGRGASALESLLEGRAHSVWFDYSGLFVPIRREYVRCRPPMSHPGSIGTDGCAGRHLIRTRSSHHELRRKLGQAADQNHWRD